ncbi:MAG: hypothetical protein WCZ19_00845 [Acholeplasma sp.]
MHKTYILENEQLKVEATDLAASIYQIYLKDQDKLLPMLSTPENYEKFAENTLSYGRTIGRTAGRLYRSKDVDQYVDFKGEPNYMHGGPKKFAGKIFSVKKHTKDTIVFELHVPHLSDGFVGNLNVLVTYRLFQGNLIVWHQAKTDQDTLLNMTFHPYFNLEQSNKLDHHELKIESSTYLSQNEDKIFTYENDVAGTHRDFTQFKPLKINIDNQLDDIYLLPKDRFSATLKTQSIEMKVFTNYNALVVYTQNKSNNTDLVNAKKEALYTGVAIEAQKSQKDLNVLKHDRIYDHYIMYNFKKI